MMEKEQRCIKFIQARDYIYLVQQEMVGGMLKVY